MASSSTLQRQPELDPRTNRGQPYDDWLGLSKDDTAADTDVSNRDPENGGPKKKRRMTEAARKKRNERSHNRRRTRRRAERDKLLEELAIMGLEWFPIFRKFPDEFQRSIFEIAYHQEKPNDGAQLALVSRKVKEWIEPLIYRNIFLPTYHYGIPDQRAELLSRTLESGMKPMSFYTKYVRSIYTNADKERKISLDVDLLSICTNIRNLECWSQSEELKSLIQTTQFPKLETLCVNFDLFPRTSSPFSCPIFQHITHLDIAFHDDCKFSSTTWTKLVGLVNLTHMRVKVPSEADESAAAMGEVIALASVVKPHLPPNLRYLVLLMNIDWLWGGIILEDPTRWDNFEAIRLGGFDRRILLGCYSETNPRYVEPEAQEKISRYEEFVAMLPDVTMPRQFLDERFTWREVERIASKRQEFWEARILGGS